MPLSRVDYEDWERHMLLDCGLNEHFVDAVSASNAYEHAAITLFLKKDISSNKSKAISFAILLMKTSGTFRDKESLTQIKNRYEGK